MNPEKKQIQKQIQKQIDVDVVIIGGGITGLLAFRRLKNLGFSVLLLEKNALGSGQTLASQGIIHGGSKYALQGKLSGAAQHVSQMTSVWGEYLSGGKTSGVDLSRVKILSPHHYLWASGFGASLKTLISSKVLSSQNRVLNSGEYPELFKHPNFSGSLCELDEVVLDIPSLLEELIGQDQKYLIQINQDWEFHQSHPEIHSGTTPGIDKITYKNQELNIDLSLKAKTYIFTAGKGNEEFLTQKLMQKRPLKMVMVKHPNLQPIYAHYVGSGTVPELTITSHLAHNNKNNNKNNNKSWVWYLGGAIAEEGVLRSNQEQYLAAMKLLRQRFLWSANQINFEEAEYAVLDISRAEIFNHGKRPDSYGILKQGNTIFAWPTKLTLAPALVEELVHSFPDFVSLGPLTPNPLCPFQQKQKLENQMEEKILENLPAAIIGKAPWETAKWEKIQHVTA